MDDVELVIISPGGFSLPQRAPDEETKCLNNETVKCKLIQVDQEGFTTYVRR